MKFLMSLVLTIILGGVFAQQPGTPPTRGPNQIINGMKNGEWIIWYDQNWIETTIKDSVVYFRKISFQDDKPIGKAFDYFLDGKLQWEGKLLAVEPNEVPHGEHTWYYTNGNKSSQVNFDNGILNGSYTIYYENGNIETTTVYENGLAHGIFEGFYPDGAKKATGKYNRGERIEKWSWYDENGQIIVERDYATTDWLELYTIANDFVDDKNYQHALPFAEKAQIYAELQFGTNHENYPKSLNLLALLNYKMAEYDKAEALYLETLEKARISIGEDHRDYTTYLKNLALLYMDSKKHEEAITILSDLSSRIEGSMGKANITFIDNLNNLASEHYYLGNYSIAINFYTEILEIAKEVLGEDHPDYNTYLRNLGVTYTADKRYEEAIPLFLDLSNRIENSLGKNHFSFLSNLNYLGLAYYYSGKHSTAISYYLKTIEIAEKILGEDDPYHSVYLNNLALAYTAIGQYEEAKHIYLQAIEKAQTSLGEEHEYYTTYLQNLAALNYDIGNYKEAIPLFAELSPRIEKAVGKNHSSYVWNLNYLGLSNYYLGYYSAAIPFYSEAIEITKLVLGEEHPDYSVYIHNLALAYSASHRYEEAKDLYIKVLEKTRASSGDQHRSYTSYLQNLAELYIITENYEEASVLYLEFIAHLKKTLGETNPYYKSQVSYLANYFSDLKLYDTASLLFEELLIIIEKTSGKNQIDYAGCLLNLGDVNANLQKDSLALSFYVKAASHVDDELTFDPYGNAAIKAARLLNKFDLKDEALVYYFKSLSSFRNKEQTANAQYVTIQKEVIDFLKNKFGVEMEMEGSIPPQIILVSPQQGRTTTSSFTLKAKIFSPKGLESIVINHKKQPISGSPNEYDLEKTMELLEGENTFEIIAKDMAGQESAVSFIKIDYKPRLQRNHALFFATDEYEHSIKWSPLNNPIKDATHIAAELYSNYNFDTTVIRNPSRLTIEETLIDFEKKTYGSQDHLFIFFAGHGAFRVINEETHTGRGYLVASDSKDEWNSNLSFAELSDYLSRNPCPHILVMLDVCYSGTFFKNIAGYRGEMRGAIASSNNAAQASHQISDNLKFKSKFCITSSGNEPVSDGYLHSPFAYQLLALLRQNKDRILTTSYIMSELEKVESKPKLGQLEGHEPGGDFIFIPSRE